MKKFLLLVLLGPSLYGSSSDHVLTNHFRSPHHGHTICHPEYENCKKDQAKQETLTLTSGVVSMGTKNVGPLFYTGGIQAENFMGTDEKIHFNALKSIDNNSKEHLSLDYEQPLFKGPFQLVMSAFSDKFHHIGKDFKALDLHIIKQNFKLGLAYLFANESEKKIRSELALEMTNTKDEIRSLGSKSQDRVRKIVITNTYEGIDGWYGKNLIDFKLKHGMPELGGSKDRGQTRVRRDSHTRFWIGNLTLQRLQKLPYGMNAGVTFVGQVTDRRVAFSELMKPKTPLFWSFYPDIFFLGDSGYEYKLKLGYEIESKGLLKKSELYGFFSYFDLRKRGKPSGISNKLHASSTHLGFRGQLSEYADFFAELVIPTKKQLQNEKMVKKGIFGLNFKVKL
jgi:hemolysin activation/secretion protein